MSKIRQRAQFTGVPCLSSFGVPQLLVNFKNGERGLFVALRVDRLHSKAEVVNQMLVDFFGLPLSESLKANRFAVVGGDLLLSYGQSAKPSLMLFVDDIQMVDNAIVSKSGV